MKITTRKVYVVECPTCKHPVDLSGEGGVYFKTRKDAQEQADLWLGTAGVEGTVTDICGCQYRKGKKEIVYGAESPKGR